IDREAAGPGVDVEIAGHVAHRDPARPGIETEVPFHAANVHVSRSDVHEDAPFHVGHFHATDAEEKLNLLSGWNLDGEVGKSLEARSVAADLHPVTPTIVVPAALAERAVFANVHVRGAIP